MTRGRSERCNCLKELSLRRNSLTCVCVHLVSPHPFTSSSLPSAPACPLERSAQPMAPQPYHPPSGVASYRA